MNQMLPPCGEIEVETYTALTPNGWDDVIEPTSKSDELTTYP